MHIRIGRIHLQPIPANWLEVNPATRLSLRHPGESNQCLRPTIQPSGPFAYNRPRTKLKRLSQTRASGKGSLLSLYGLLCLSLGFMVFAWGTNYKLSLYNAGHQNCPAKVCTRGSEAAKHAFDCIPGRSTAIQTPLLLAALLTSPEGTQSYRVDRQRREAMSDLSPLRRAPILYLRPPPDEAFLLE